MDNISLLRGTPTNPFGISVDYDGGNATALALTTSDGSARFTLDPVISVPVEVLELLAKGPPMQYRLKSLADLRKQMAQLPEQPAIDLEQIWRHVVAQISTATFTLDANAKFLGAVVFPGGAANIAGKASLNLGACMLDTAILMHAWFELEASCNVAINGTDLTTRMAWRIEIEGGTATNIPHLAIRLPDLGWSFPGLDFRDFKWPGLAGKGAFIDLRLTALPGIPLKFVQTGLQTSAVYNAATGALEVTTTCTGAALELYGRSVQLGTPSLSYRNGVLTITGLNPAPPTLDWTAQNAIELPTPLNGVSLLPGAGSLQLELAISANGAELSGVLMIEELTIFPSAQPLKIIKLGLTLPFNAEGFPSSVLIGGVSVPREIKLLAPDAFTLAGELLSYAKAPASICVNLPFPQLAVPDVEPLIEVLAAILGAIARTVAGLARVVESGLRVLFALLQQAASKLSKLEVALILDARTGHLQQVLVSLHHPKPAKDETEVIIDAAGCVLSAPSDADLALLIDLRDGARDAYLVATVDVLKQPILKLETDLWFAGADFERPAGEVRHPSQAQGNAPAAKLITIDVAASENQTGARCSVIPFGIRHGEAVFFQALAAALPRLPGAGVGFQGFELVPLPSVLAATATFPEAEELKKRFLPFLAAPSDRANGSGMADLLKQYVRIEGVEKRTVDLKEGRFEAKADIIISVLGSEIRSQLALALGVRSMTASVHGGEIKLSLPKNKPFELLGMTASFEFKDPSETAEVDGEQFVLDLRNADNRLYVNSKLKMLLEFGKLGRDANGKALRFEVTSFVLHGGGIDLDANLARSASISLNGLNTNFEFETVALRIRGGTVEAFSLKANGKLPPALLGDTPVRLQLDFGQRADGSFGMLNGELFLLLKGAPIRCENTHFVLTLKGLSLRAFEADGSLHFCAFISGSAMFKPQAPKLAESLLKKLAGLELNFNDCPISGDSEVIRRELARLSLSFGVALEQPVRASVFEVFSFKVAYIGFEPRCLLFGNPTPALVVGGQIEFGHGDVIRAECDFHRCYVAPAERGFLPRVRCEGLGLALRFGRALEIDGMLVAVDGQIGSPLESTAPSNRLEGKGFMGQGRVAIQGLPPIAASFGFVEVSHPDTGALMKAWFIYLEAQRISYHFQLGPVPIFLREAALGMGFGFTHVAIAAVDSQPNLPGKIQALDDIAAKALEPAKLPSWTVTGDADLTLVARVMISMSSASAPGETLTWREKEEKDLPNVLLLNAVAALRQDTFLMTTTVWLGYNYWDWDNGRHIGNNEMTGKHAMVGYVLLSGARSEFLARLKSNRGGIVGPRLPLPPEFTAALQEVDYEATLYIRPGLLHFELGWPNRLRWNKNFAGFNVSVAGGAIFRVHEGAILVGLNLEGSLSFEMSGRLDAGVVGVAVSASVYAALTARIIGYLDSQRASQSLYYSLFSMQLRVRFEISAWLEIDAWLCKITIRISFALALQIDVAAEIALQGDLAIGARARATIVVSIFGRSLGLSVGLGVNPGLVDQAASRVGRFMELGLTQEVPAVAPDLNQQKATSQQAVELGEQRRTAREVASLVARNTDKLAPVPHEDPAPPITSPALKDGVKIEGTDFQIVLTYPKAAPAMAPALAAQFDPADWVYLTFLPLEPAKGGGRSGFYAAPWERDAPLQHGSDHDIEWPAQITATNVYVFVDKQWGSIPITHGLRQESSVRWEKTLQFTQSTSEHREDGTPADHVDKATLTQLFFAAFRTDAPDPSKVFSANPYQEPNARPRVQAEDMPPERDCDNTQQRYQAQESSYSEHIKEDPADRRCHEARDFLMQMFISDLFQLAADGVVPFDTVHVVHLGLTLLVRRKLAAELDACGPIIHKRVGVAPDSHEVSGACAVFNPWRLAFVEKPPRFDKPRQHFGGNKVCLDWDLIWDHSIEPEHFIQNYEIKRWIVSPNRTDTEPHTVTIKRADAMQWNGQDKARTRRRSPWQFTDEFEDMSAEDRALLFDPLQNVVLRYFVAPICVSGTTGAQSSPFSFERVGQPHAAAVRHASAILTIDPRPAGASPVSALELRMRIEAGADRLAEKDQRKWRIVVRSEAIVPAGDYGSDAETNRPLGATIGTISALRQGDFFFDIDADDNDVFPANGDTDKLAYGAVTAKAAELVKALKNVVDPKAYTLFVQTVVIRKGEEIEFSHLVPVQLGIEIKPADQAFAGATVPARVDALELVRVPMAADLALLEPIARVDVTALPGRASLRDPTPGSAKKIGSGSIVHSDFGGLTVLKWNLRPHALQPNAAARHRLVSGFEIRSLDLDGLAPAELEGAWASARVERPRSARLLDAESLMLTPAELGEPSNWKARYPSETARRIAGSWYSDAESYIDWPRPDIRRNLLPEPGYELIKALLREGPPHFIELSMTRDGAPKNTEFELVSAAPGGWSLLVVSANKTRLQWDAKQSADGCAGDLLEALRGLRWKRNSVEPGVPVAEKAGWELSLQSGWGKDATPLHVLLPEPVPMHFERDLHPLLEAILTRMRRWQPAHEPARLLDLDRRPPPVLDADTVETFFGVTGAAADPYGWTILDKLRLGVTVRLFDPVRDVYLKPRELIEQLRKAVAALPPDGLYADVVDKLFIEVLLQPGAMMRREDFATLPDADGVMVREKESDLLTDHALAMVRISIRPAIVKQAAYWAFSQCADAASSKPMPGTMVMLLEDRIEHSLEADQNSLKQILTARDAKVEGPEATGKTLHRAIARAENFELGEPDQQPGLAGTESVDAFSRFSALGWSAAATASVVRFHLTLCNALGLAAPEGDGGAPRKLIEDMWLAWNARFFEFAAIPGKPWPQYAFAAPAAVEPALVAADAAGRLSVMIPEADGYARQRAFAVLPQWRYGRILKAAGHVLPTPPKPNPAFGKRYAISTIERTAPLQPAGIRPLGRLGDQVWWRSPSQPPLLEAETPSRTAASLQADGWTRLGTDPGNALAVMLPHHAEQRLSKGNVVPARRLSFSGSLTTFVLRLSDAEWCGRAGAGASLEPAHRARTPLATPADPDLLARVAEQLGEAPTDATIKSLRHLPHWYRHAVAVSAGAGGVVAEPVAAYLPEAPARLWEVVAGVLRLKSGHPWGQLLDALPTLSVVLDGAPKVPQISVTIPALRYRDNTDTPTAELWAGEIANLADPAVIYEAELTAPAQGLRTRKAVTPLARIAPEPAPAGSGVAPVAPADLFGVFALSPDWRVRCAFVAGNGPDPAHTLAVSITPMAKPVALSSDLPVALDSVLRQQGALSGTAVRAPGGWSCHWLDYLVEALIAYDAPNALARTGSLWGDLRAAQVGVPLGQFAALEPLFYSYAPRLLTISKPADAAARQALLAALDAWIAGLSVPGVRPLGVALARMLGDLRASIANGDWPLPDAPFPVPWQAELAKPTAPIQLDSIAESPPRLLMPELMTDAELAVAKALVDADTGKRLDALVEAQRANAMADGGLQLRAARGDAIALELPLLFL